MSSLQNKYLPEAQFKSKISIPLDATPERVFPCIQHFYFTDDQLSCLFFKTKPFPLNEAISWEKMETLRCYKLNEVNNESITVGLIGRFWLPKGDLVAFTPEEFTLFSDPSFAKATWDFRIIPWTKSQCLLETETRVSCLSQWAYEQFKRYWMFIKPFNDFIRYELLKSIKKKVISHAEIQ